MTRDQSNPLPIVYPPELPVSRERDTLLGLLREQQILVVAGETGSGKSTQLPKICLEAGLAEAGLIGITQPRRIAARSLAARVAEELNVAVGGMVGYQVRFSDRSGDDTQIKFMTDGILLAEIQRDPDLRAYRCLIIDEAHERSLNIDFLLGYLKRLCRQRPDLTLIVTSATIDVEKFSRHFDDAPVIEVSGRGYPVEVLYRPMEEDNGLNAAIAAAIDATDRIDPRGDILVFLATEREIREALKYLERRSLRHTEVLPLFGRLSSAAQQAVFHPGTARRIVLATNVAETSLTVPRIRFVIDSGRARISRYAHRSQVQRLPIEPISQASADQRKGRCGRVGPGTCIRLYSEEDYLSRPEYTEPEILRTSLASVILHMAAANLGRIETFPFIDPPAPRMIREAWNQLFELQAVDRDERATRLGRRMVSWPLDVRFARILQAAPRHHCLTEALIIAAFSSIQDPRERPLDAQQAADEAHAEYEDEKSDFLTVLRLWETLTKERKALSRRRFDRFCRQAFLAPQRVREWQDLYRQLRGQARRQRLALNSEPAAPEQIHQALLTGLLAQVGLRQEEGDYLAPRGRRFHLFPGSALYPKGGRWLMAAELVETRRVYARMAALIHPRWIEQAAAHLLKSSYFEPHWSRKRGEVMAWEQVSLYGLPVIERRRARYAPVAPEEARLIFIREALVEHRLGATAPVLTHNRKVINQVSRMEAKRRRRDLLVPDQALQAWYDERLPDDILDRRALMRWLADHSPQQSPLRLSPDDVLIDDGSRPDREDYPDQYSIAGGQWPLVYHFEPGSANDGISLRLPLAYLNHLDPGRLEWLVPGLRHEKVTALLRILPKPVRRALGPAPDFARRMLDRAPAVPEQTLAAFLSGQVKALEQLEIAPADWPMADLPDYLRLRVELLDEQGRVVAAGRDVSALQERFGASARSAFMEQEGGDWHQDGLRQWPDQRLPEQVATPSGGKAYPALVDQTESAVGLRLFATASEAEAHHRAAVRRLLAVQLADKWRYFRKRHGLTPEAQLACVTIEPLNDLLDGILDLSLRQLSQDAAAVREDSEFQTMLTTARPAILALAAEQVALLNAILPAHAAIRRALSDCRDEAARNPAIADGLPDAEQTLEDLFYPGFLYDLEPGLLAHYPRYLEALRLRLETLSHHPARDRDKARAVTPHWQRYQTLWENEMPYDARVAAYRWMLHEWRVSVFAQALGTDGPVSAKRLDKAWSALEAGDGS